MKKCPVQAGLPISTPMPMVTPPTMAIATTVTNVVQVSLAKSASSATRVAVFHRVKQALTFILHSR